ncbi:MAG: hypothetical protein ACLFWL_18570, partial [Candidatus Brocadiia bacterium]
MTIPLSFNKTEVTVGQSFAKLFTVPVQRPSPEGQNLSRPALALSIGMIHHLAGREQKALAFFEFAGGRSGDKNSRDRRPMAGATSLPIAFSEFGRGAALQSGKKT